MTDPGQDFYRLWHRLDQTLSGTRPLLALQEITSLLRTLEAIRKEDLCLHWVIGSYPLHLKSDKAHHASENKERGTGSIAVPVRQSRCELGLRKSHRPDIESIKAEPRAAAAFCKEKASPIAGPRSGHSQIRGVAEFSSS